MLQGRPGDRQMPDPQAVKNFKGPLSGLECEQMPEGGGEGHRWN